MIFPRLKACLLLLLLTLLGTVVIHAQEEQPRLLIDPGGHTDKIRDVMFTQDGRHLISAGYDKVVRVWDTQQDKIERTIRSEIGDGAVGMIYAAALSPDDRYLAVAGWLPPAPQANPIRLHEFSSGKVITLLAGHQSDVLDLAFSPDGRYLASASADNTVFIWDIERRSAIQHLQGHTEPVLAVAFSVDGRRLASGGKDHTLRLWDTERGTLLGVLRGHQGAVDAVAFSPDGRYLVSGSDDKTVRLWDARTGEFVRILGSQEAAVTSLSFSRDGQRLLTGAGSDGGNYACTLLAVPSGRVLIEFSKHNNVVLATALSPDGKTAATAGGDNNEIYLWNTETDQIIHKLAGQGRIVWSVGFAQDGRSIAYGNQFDLATPEPLLGPLQRVIWLDKDGDLALGDQLPAADQKNYNTALIRQGEYELRTHDGSNVYQSVLQVVKAGQVLYEIRRDSTSGSRHRSYTLTHNTQYIVSGGSGGVLVLYRADTGAVVRQFIGHTDDVEAVAVSPDDRTLVSGSADGTVRLWDLESGKNLLSFFVSADGEWIAWTPEGYYKSSVNGDKYIGWHINQGADKAADYYTAERFQKTFYQPAVVFNYFHTGGNIQLALEQARQKLDKPIEPPPKLARILPPAVILQIPAPESVVQDHTLQLNASIVLSNTLPTTVEVRLNGKTIKSQVVKGIRDDQLPFTYKIEEEIDFKEDDLNEGKNDVAIYAFHDKANAKMELHKIIYHPPKPLEPPNLILLAVGISKYRNQELQLKYAAGDARTIADIFKSQEGVLFPKVEIQVLTDAEATLSNIKNNIEWLTKQGNPRRGDIHILFLSGHGEQDDNDDYYFLPADRNPKYSLYANGIGGSDLYRPIKAGNFILILDTCKAGAARYDINPAIMKLKTDHPEVIVFASSKDTENSEETEGWKNGALTKVLLEGLKDGKADSNKDNLITTEELGGWIKEQVAKLTNGKQHPITYYSFGAEPFKLFSLRQTPSWP